LDFDPIATQKETCCNMLKQSMLGPVPQDVELAVKELLREDTRYTLTEMRSRYRENLVVPVKLFYRNGEPEMGFSKNVSEAGICVITQNAVPENEILDLEIYRLYGSPIRITSDARWCRPFGQCYYMSGWKFLHLRKG
jgi:hypothetical protein